MLEPSSAMSFDKSADAGEGAFPFRHAGKRYAKQFELCPKNKARGGDKNTMDFAGLRSLRERFRLMVEPRGIEPLTSSLRTTRSPN